MSYIKLTITLYLITLTINQVPTGYALNGCGKLTDYSIPTSKSDCDVDKSEGYKCCFIKSDSSSLAYCAYVPGKLDDDIIDDFKEAIGIDDLSVECNFMKFIHVNFSFLFTLFLVLLF